MNTLTLNVDAPKVNKCIIRLKTTVWYDKRGLHMRKDIVFLRRKCVGFNILEEEFGMVGADDVLRRITNLTECADGVYLVDEHNISHDWETGYVDSYDLRLLPYSLPCK